ncbi:type VI secretion system baseplate subunit TssK [Photorhabdus kleinii]|uniref:type VI secretion system baseplate subunit TssK n=1 Tax=Photorhabdus kleinii TaxID=768034 RepID=UPI0021D4C320|nr:type VI secretion system baseplate subunit TssK [Photorhabdus kleinii]MCT8342716.1 type VI secretion system baseplate subunit TssK [Photorhabdus kleinii]
MKNAHKVLWMEGMFLRPHHFQQADEYVDARLRQWGALQRAYNWGFSSLKLDESQLALGKISLLAASGIMPDGTTFEFTETDEAPPTLEISPSLRSQIITLAIPAYLAGRESVSFDDAPDSLARYQAFEKEVNDVNALTLGSTTLHCGRLRLRLLPKNELNGEWIAMGVLRVLEKNQDGVVILDTGYIPPLLNCWANSLLQRMTSDLYGLLLQRCQQLSRHLQYNGSSTRDLLQQALLNRFCAQLQHIMHLPQQAPETLFLIWISYALEMSSFQVPYTLEGELPRYNHQDIGGCFTHLLTLLQRNLSIVLEEYVVSLPLTKRLPGLNVASLPEQMNLSDYHFILAVKSEIEHNAFMAHFPAQIKIAPADHIRDLVRLQLPGIALHHLAQIPRQLPYQNGFCYFKLALDGETEQSLRKSGVFAFYVAGEFPSLKMAFWALKRLSDDEEINR